METNCALFCCPIIIRLRISAAATVAATAADAAYDAATDVTSAVGNMPKSSLQNLYLKGVLQKRK